MLRTRRKGGIMTFGCRICGWGELYICITGRHCIYGILSSMALGRTHYSTHIHILRIVIGGVYELNSDYVQ